MPFSLGFAIIRFFLYIYLFGLTFFCLAKTNAKYAHSQFFSLQTKGIRTILFFRDKTMTHFIRAARWRPLFWKWDDLLQAKTTVRRQNKQLNCRSIYSIWIGELFVAITMPGVVIFVEKILKEASFEHMTIIQTAFLCRWD